MDQLLRTLRRWGNAGAVANVGNDLTVDRDRLLAVALLGERLDQVAPTLVAAQAA